MYVCIYTCEDCVCMHVYAYYGVASVSRIDQIICLFCKRALQKRQYSAKETYNSIDPTNRIHPIETTRHTTLHYTYISVLVSVLYTYSHVYISTYLYVHMYICKCKNVDVHVYMFSCMYVCQTARKKISYGWVFDCH